MKDSELKEIKELLEEKIKREEKLINLADNKFIRKVTNISKLDIEPKAKYELLKLILKKYHITETNEILVCTSNYNVGFECGDLYTIPKDFSEETGFRSYKDIESGKVISACRCRYIESDESLTIPEAEENI